MVAHRAFQSIAHVLDLLDQNCEIQLGKAAGAQQIGLGFELPHGDRVSA
jgi:hypothetical protein